MKEKKICVVGMGYVGLPLAYNFAKQGFTTYGFDICPKKIIECKYGLDRTREVGESVNEVGIIFTNDEEVIRFCDFIIVAVPTPTINGTPDLKFLKSATEMIGKNMKPDTIVVYESTVYPFCTENFCLPILVANSNLVYDEDFFIGFSPERINPGDKENKVTNITKIVAGNNKLITDKLADLYRYVTPNVYLASSIAVAESAKILENSQRDVNIALVNQFAMLYPDISTCEVVDAMDTKWNALGFTPGLVGGHCIAEDPNYLTKQCMSFGKRFTLLEESRNINESVAGYVVNNICDHYRVSKLSGIKVLIKGVTFKANVNDVRNSKAYDLYKYLVDLGASVEIYDPIADSTELKKLYNIELNGSYDIDEYDVVIYTVGHQNFLFDEEDLLMYNKELLVFDIPSLFYQHQLSEKITYRSL
jgi:UDP-N-acetyl-D-galactosamine dehydrogenase